MSRADIELKVRQAVATELGISAEDVPADGDLEALGADSMNVVDIVMELEDAYGLEVPEEAMEAVKLVSDLTNYVAARVS
jgi:acyl carrier protein